MKDKQNDREIYDNVVAIGLGIWFGSVALYGLIGFILKLGN